MTDPKTIERSAERVADQHRAYAASAADRDAAQSELFVEAMQALRRTGVLPAICSPVQSQAREEVSALVLLREGAGTGRDWYLLLLEDGSVVRDSHRGLDAVPDVGPHGFVAVGGPDAVPEALLRVSIALDAQLRGGKHKVTEKMRREADQFRALAVLARSVGRG